MKSAAALERRTLAHPFVVSGERLCKDFQEGMMPAEAQRRSGLRLDEPWQTSRHRGGAGLLPKAGTEMWRHEAARALEHLGFVARQRRRGSTGMRWCCWTPFQSLQGYWRL